MNNGLLDHTHISRDLLFKQWREGQISKSDYDVLSKSIKVESQVIRSIQDVIELKQKILLAQGKDIQAYEGVNFFDGFKIDPREEFHKCKEQYQNITAEKCYSWSRESDNQKKCVNCEWYEKVGKILNKLRI
ncbi:MAG: hypothetical protein K8R53_06825 [Bacteroidales bacterium]|nr:hypothetical protein [Bacteroidales bacterium]